MASRADPLETMPVSRHGGTVRWGLRLMFGALIVFLYLPILFMIVFSFDEGATPGLPITGFTTHWYEAMLNNRVLLRAVSNSIIVAVIVSILATIIGTMAAFVLVRARIRFPNATRIAFTLPIMVPGVLIGVSLLIYFARVLDISLSLATVIGGHLVVTVPFVVLIVASRLQSFDRFLEWAAADLGASPRQAIRHIVLPLIAPAILAGALISVTLSIDEFVITWFTVGSQPTLPTFIYTRVKFGVTPEVNAVATVMLVLTLGTLGLAGVALGRARRVDGSDAAATAGRLMRAAVFKGAGVLALEDVPEPVVEADDDVIIEVEACGICGSDLQILNVPPGHPADPGVILGHEFIGRVTALGSQCGRGRARGRPARRRRPRPEVRHVRSVPRGTTGQLREHPRTRRLPARRPGAADQGAGRVHVPALRGTIVGDRRAHRAARLRGQQRQQGEPAAG